MIEVNGVQYKKPEAFLIQESGLGVAEYAGRTAYDSFEHSENREVRIVNKLLNNGAYRLDPESREHLLDYLCEINNIDGSELLDKLAHVYHHDSVLEHIYLQYLVKGTSRGVLQEHARHRMQSITVRSTRYTMSPIINAFNSSNSFNEFKGILDTLDFLVTDGPINNIEYSYIWEKLVYQKNNMELHKFQEISMSKEQRQFINSCSNLTSKEKFEKLQSMKQKRNVGDPFKHIVTDNWKVDLVFSMNLRALSNYLKLRDSNAAYFQIKWLAEEIVKVTPQKYLKLIDKKYV